MSSVSAEVIIQKFEALPELAKIEVANFIDAVFRRSERIKKKRNKKKLLEVSCWSDEDIKAIQEAGKMLNTWKIET